MAKKSGLGRGLDMLFADVQAEQETREDTPRIRLSLIEPKPDQPRQNFDPEALAALADSISENGVLQPILVRPGAQEGFYQIIAGERRWRASKMAGLTEIPAVIVDADELTAARYSLIENLQREDLDPWEEATAYQRLLEEFHLRQEDLAAFLGKSRSAIANTLRLLDLPEEIVALLREGKLSAGHCRALLSYRDTEKVLPLAQKIMLRNLSVRETENMVKNANRAYMAAQRSQGLADEDTVRVDYAAELAHRATAAIGRTVQIKAGKRRKILSVEYQNDDDLADLLYRLCGGNIID